MTRRNLSRPLWTTVLLVGVLLATSAPRAAEPWSPAEHRRGPEQTFLTFPEWYLVHSPAEYAAYLGSHAPSGFPLFAHIGQFWQSYRAVSSATAEYPFNGGYHLMVSVIGTSTTVEYGLKGLYERTAGRIAEATAGGTRTAEDDYAARVAQEYVDFIREQPWYEFEFGSRLKGLWASVPWSGPHLLRKWERRYALTTEYLVKDGYARLIKLGTQSMYDAPKPTTAVAVDRLPAGAAARLPDLAMLRTAPDGSALILVPRYAAFKDHAAMLADDGASFLEIAGNRSEILLSVLARTGWTPEVRGARVLFTQPILTAPGRERVVVAVPVTGLAEVLRAARADGSKLEHVYDY
jgi:hypothetical protein